MVDKKLTVGEIKKALEHCAGLPCLCSDCVLFEPEDDDCQCSSDLKLNALDLINRQKAEIEKMKDEYRWLDQESDILQADVENLSRMCDEVNAENESLKAEIERLQKDKQPMIVNSIQYDFCGVPCKFMEEKINYTQADNKRLKADIEELKAINGSLKADRPFLVAIAKAEAYKEFAERLRSIIMWSPKNHISITAKDVEMILKELVGKSND